MDLISTLLVAASLISTPARTHSDETFAPSKAELAQADLFMAVTIGKIGDVKAALDAGANPNTPDFIDMMPVWFVQDPETAKLLFMRGANLNAETTKGSLLTNALLFGADRPAAQFLDMGANPNAKRPDGSNPLTNASFSGSLLSLRRLLDKKVDVNRHTADGATALTFATRGNQAEAAKMLLAAGAQIDATDRLKRTPLHYAALYDLPDMAKLLISHGASVRAVDANGETPLHLAAHYSGDAKMIRTLLSSGAAKNAADKAGQTPYQLAARRGYAAARLLGTGGVVPVSNPKSVSGAIRPSLALIQRSMTSFQQQTSCISCHHQGLGAMVLARASKQKYSVNAQILQACLKQVGDDMHTDAPVVHACMSDRSLVKMVPVVHLGDAPYMNAYVMGAQSVAGVRPNQERAERAMLVAGFQNPDGSWASLSRGTMEHSNVTTTALVLDSIRPYWPADRKAELAEHAAKAKGWATTFKSTCDEDLAGRIMILRSAGGSERDIALASRAFLAKQRADGGWGLPTSPRSDAYTTGLGLYALRHAGRVPASDRRIRAAVAFLLRTQDRDGSWYESKAVVAQNSHFDSDFPHGFDQYASFAASCWATIGLLEVSSGS